MNCDCFKYFNLNNVTSHGIFKVFVKRLLHCFQLILFCQKLVYAIHYEDQCVKKLQGRPQLTKTNQISWNYP